MNLVDQIVPLLEGATEYARYYAGICPFHEDNKPSLLVFKDGWYRCLACGHNGDHEGLLRKLKGWGGVGPSKMNTAWSPLQLKQVEGWNELAYRSHDLLLRYEDTLGWYLRMRGVHDLIVPCHLGWWDGWYIIPIRDETGNFLGLVARAGKHIEEAKGYRYYVPKEQPPLMYVPDWIKFKSNKYIVVVFGMFDALALSQLSYPVCTPTNGMRSFDPDWLVEQRKMIYILPDAGEEEAAYKLVGRLGWRGKVIRLNYPESMKDPADFVQQGKANLLQVQLTTL